MSDITKLRKSLDGYMREVLRVVPQMYVQSEGREVLGLVSGRSEAEDMEIGVDRMCEDLLEKWLIRSGFRIDLHSEHSLREIGGDGLPKYLVTCDPFDGSTHFMRGIPAEWWSVLTFWEASTMQPVLAGAADIGRQELYFADEKGVVVETAATGKKVKVFPADYSALGDHSVIAAYLMAPAYLDVWTKRTDKTHGQSNKSGQSGQNTRTKRTKHTEKADTTRGRRETERRGQTEQQRNGHDGVDSANCAQKHLRVTGLQNAAVLLPSIADDL